MKISLFVTSQQSTGLDSDSDVQEVRMNKPDSTQPKVVQGSDSGSEDIPSAQTSQKKKKRARIESTSTVDQQEEKREVDTEDDPEAAVVMEL